jgi:hypothetical protein
MHCFSSEKLFRFEAIADVQHLPLPWPENNFEAGIPPSDVATTTNGVNTGSIFSDLIRGLHLWYIISILWNILVLTIEGPVLHLLSDPRELASARVSSRSSALKATF